MSEPVVKVADVLEASKGMLQKQLYVVITRPTNGLGPVMENLEAHLAHQVKIEADGIMVGAGPFWLDDEETWGGEGMFIIRAGSLAEARKIAESDPMHSSGARSFEVRPWLLNEGTITVKISFSKNERELI